MGKVIINNFLSNEQQEIERHRRFKNLSTQEKFNELFALIDLTVKLNGGLPIKQPQGKGVILRKENGPI